MQTCSRMVWAPSKDARPESKLSLTPNLDIARLETIPFALRQKVEAEIERLVAESTLEPVTHSAWATPVVSVLKSDQKSVKLCGDFKVTVNSMA